MRKRRRNVIQKNTALQTGKSIITTLNARRRGLIVAQSHYNISIIGDYHGAFRSLSQLYLS